MSGSKSIKIEEDINRVKQRFSIIGEAPSLLEAIGRAILVAPIDLSVLVTGESGSGKEFFPKIIHQFGARKHKKYIAVNCGAIPEGTIDSELFGHEKGSFTGAISTRKGYFEEADGGTIFLDEVAELPLTTQARLLRVLETGEFFKVGSSVVQKTDIRIVAATNVNLLEAVSKGKFREDLYYRLSTVVIPVPSLHDRGEDVILLARKFARDFSSSYMTPAITFREDAKRVLMLYSWPGNVRQLKNIVEQLALFHAGEEITKNSILDLLPHYPDNSSIINKSSLSYDSEREMLWKMIFSLRSQINELYDRVEGQYKSPISPSDSILGANNQSSTSLITYPEEQVINLSMEPIQTLEQTEKNAIESSLIRNGGNKKKTAKELSVAERTLYRKIHEYGLEDVGTKST